MQARSRGGCLINGGWNPLTNNVSSYHHDLDTWFNGQLDSVNSQISYDEMINKSVLLKTDNTGI